MTICKVECPRGRHCHQQQISEQEKAAKAKATERHCVICERSQYSVKKLLVGHNGNCICEDCARTAYFLIEDVGKVAFPAWFGSIDP